MKKVIFLFAMIFAVTFVMAQNTAETIQNGDGNDAVVTQIGALHDATVDQFGDDNEAAVAQKNSNNIAAIGQLKGDENEADIAQDGVGNKAALIQGLKVGFVSTVSDDPLPTDIDIVANGNIGSINQIGTDNFVEYWQMGDDNNGGVKQDGNRNGAYLYQGWPGGVYGGPLAMGSRNKGSIEQIGDENWGAIWNFGSDNEAYISQDGDNNKADVAQGYIYQNTVDRKFPVTDNFADVSQNGDLNHTRVFQLGDNNSFTLVQNGNGNDVGGERFVDDRAEYFQQRGDDNTFTGEQNDGATLDHASFQEGNYNEIDLLQGDSDIGLIQQLGNLNEATLKQYGGGQDATMIQTGNSNSASVTQQQ